MDWSPLDGTLIEFRWTWIDPIDLDWIDLELIEPFIPIPVAVNQRPTKERVKEPTSKCSIPAPEGKGQGKSSTPAGKPSRGKQENPLTKQQRESRSSAYSMLRLPVVQGARAVVLASK